MKKNSLFSMEKFSEDKISAIDAKFEAQKIAFAPLTFQAIRALLELGVMKKISDSGDDGISAQELSLATGISDYGIKVLCEMAVGMNVLKLKTVQDKERFFLGKIGFFLLEDNLTKVNFNFTNDICYKGAFDLADSVKNQKPEGLKVFGENWTTIYEALSSLPEREKKSWFDFDHFYSDIAFPQALPIVYAEKPKRLFDIGGNTAKWAIASCKFDADVNVTIIDLPGQTAVAKKKCRSRGIFRQDRFLQRKHFGREHRTSNRARRDLDEPIFGLLFASSNHENLEKNSFGGNGKNFGLRFGAALGQTKIRSGILRAPSDFALLHLHGERQQQNVSLRRTCGSDFRRRI